MSQEVRNEALPRLRQRYVNRGKAGKELLLDEVCEQWDYSRKHAIRLLSGKSGWGGNEAVRKGRPPIYTEAEVKVLERIWKSSEQPCGKRLKALLPLWLEPYEAEHGPLESGTRAKVLKVSAAQIDRLLAPKKVGCCKGRCGTKPGTLLKTQIPIRTDNWDIESKRQRNPIYRVPSVIVKAGMNGRGIGRSTAGEAEPGRDYAVAGGLCWQRDEQKAVV